MKTDEEILSQLIRERESTDRKRINKEYVNTVLDKIRAEIEALEESIFSYHNDRPWIFKDEVLGIIDKYKAESENEYV